jgi:hypothetical protein
MAKQTINIGAAPNDGTGTPLRTSFDYCNLNFTELYTATGPSGNNIVVPGSATISGDLTVDTSTLKVDSTNDRVGIGIAAPAYRLHVQGTASLQMVLQSNDTNANAKEGTVNVRHYTNAEEPVSAVGGFTTSTANEVYLGGGFSAGNAATLLGFYTAANNTTTVGTERYRIGSDGTSTWYVGGSTAMTLNSTGLGVGGSPTTRFEVFSGFIKNTATTGSAQIIASNTGGVFTLAKDSSTGGNFTGTAYASVLYSDGAYPVCIFSNGSERMRIDSSGNVGVGVTPSALVGATRVEIKGSNSANLSLRSGSANASARDWMVASNVAAFGDFVVRQGASQGAEPNSGTDRMYFDPSGNIIITPTSTPPTLTVNGQIAINATSNTNLRFSYRGSDGVTRVANITLA